MSLFGAKITATGLAMPEQIITNKDLETMVETSDDWIVSRTGIKERRIAAPGEGASDYAVRSARKALDEANVLPEELDLIIVATFTADSPLPATACLVQAELKATKAAAFDLAAGCTGFIYALSVGSNFVFTGMYKKVLVVGVEILSRTVNWQDRSTCVLFGDGAGAALLEPGAKDEGVLSTFLGADGRFAKSLWVEAGGSRLPVSEETLRSGKHFLFMAGNEIFKQAVREMEHSLVEALARSGLTKKDLDYVIPHQANMRIIEAIRKRMDLEEVQMVVNIQHYGNTSAASIPIALAEGVQAGKFKKGDVIGLVAFGAGLTWGAAVIRW